MRPSSRLALIGVLLAVPAIAPWQGAPAIAAPAEQTAIGTATFDPARTAIHVPYEGPVPRVSLYALPDGRYYYEFTPARLAKAGLQHHLVGDTIARYTMANRPQHPAVRISFVLLRPGAPSYRVDTEARRIVILPLGKETLTQAPGLKAPAPAVAAAPPRRPAASPDPTPHPTPSPSPAPVATPIPAPTAKPTARPIPTPSPSPAPTAKPIPSPTPEPTPAAALPRLVPKAAPKPVPSVKIVLPQGLTPPTEATMLRTELKRPYLDDFHHRLVMPFNGPAPTYAVKIHDRNPHWVYLDFDQSTVALEGEKFDSFTDPVFDGWLMTEHDGKPRLYLKFKVKSPVVAQVFPESGEMWFTTPSRAHE